MTVKITIGGREFDLAKPEESIAVQGNLVPSNWPTSPAECVRLFTATSEMLTYQLRRHLAANWQKICKQTQEELADGNQGRIKITFGFELDQSAPTVAAIAKHALSFSATHKTEGKPQTHDINQGDFEEALAHEPEIGAEEPTEATDTPAEPENPATAKETGEAPPPGNVVDIGTAQETVDKPKRGRKKKTDGS